MVDLVHPRRPWDGLLPAGGAGLGVAAREDVEMALVMARRGQGPGLGARCAELYGVAPPPGPARAAGPMLALIGLAPGQWLAVAEGRAGLAERLAGELRGLASVSDQSDGRALLRLSGPNAREILGKGVQIDLHPDVFAIGAAAATQIAGLSAWMWRLDADAYEIATPRSTAGDFAHWLKASLGGPA